MNKKYRPSNGTEGEGFMAGFCYHCIHEGFLHSDDFKQCEILSNTMVYDINDSKYPEEWIYDDNNKPVCTKYKYWDWENDGKPPSPIEPDPNQLNLFGEE